MTSFKYYLSILIAISCMQLFAQEKAITGLQEGDLLFQDLNCGELCDAIEAVTEGVNGQDFSHCAMVIRDADSLVVVEAIGSKVQVNSIPKFFARSGDTLAIKNIVVGRVKQPYKELIPQAAANAKALIGQPYDDAFLPNNNKWYCSEVLYEAFRKASNTEFFELNPMTFKDPRTQTYFPAWINYYRELNTEIPEAVLGLNPGSISRSDKIEIIKIQFEN
jgi:hypothetical protein